MYLCYTKYKTVNTHLNIRYQIYNDDLYLSMEGILLVLFITFLINDLVMKTYTKDS